MADLREVTRKTCTTLVASFLFLLTAYPSLVIASNNSLSANQLWQKNPTFSSPPVGIQNETGISNPLYYVHHFPDPVNAWNGNLFLAYQDIFIPARGFPLELSRAYNSHGSEKGLFGIGWSSSFDVHIKDPTAETLRIRNWDGSTTRYRINRSKNPSKEKRFEAEFTSTRFVIKKTNGTYILDLGNGDKNFFSRKGRLLKKLDAYGNRTHFLYNSQGNRLLAVADDAGRKLQFSYTAAGLISSLKDPTGRVLKYRYDRKANLIEMINASGESTRYSYDKNHNLSKIIQADGAIIRNAYDKTSDRIVRQQGPGKKATTYTYTGSQSRGMTRKTVVTDNAGHQTTYTYFTDNGKIKRLIVTNANNHKTSYQYDRHGNLIKLTNPTGASTLYKYDGHNRLITRIDASGSRWKYSYIQSCGCSKAATTTNPLGKTTTIRYNKQLSATTIINARGQVTRITYDPKGDLIKMMTRDGVQTRYAYDAYGNLTKMTDPTGETRYVRDILGRTTKVSLPDSTIYRYKFDTENRLAEVTKPTGFRTTYHYDAMGRMINSKNPKGQSTFTYNKAGLLTQLQDRENNPVYFTYNQTGDLISITDANGGISRFKVDALGNMLEHIDPLNRKIRYHRDALGRAVIITDAMGNRTKHVYDPAGNMIKESHGDGMLRKSYAYDAANRLVGIKIQPAGIKTEIQYDALNNLVSTTTGGVSISYDYDKAGRLNKVFENGKLINSYSYTPTGKLSRAKTKHSSINLRYNDRGLPASVSQDGMSIHYTYDKYGRKNSRIDSEGSKTRYFYDKAGRLAKSRTNNGNIFTYHYDRLSRLTGIDYPNGIQLTRQFDSVGNITLERAVNRKSETVYRKETSYNSTGNPILEKNLNGQTWEYLYDPLNRLKKATTPWNSWAYSYDALGNRTKMTKNGSTTTYKYSGDRLMSMVAGREKNRFFYDARGNLIEQRSRSKKIHYTYNAMNRLTVMRGENPDVNLKIEYDALGRKSKETINGRSTTTLFDGYQALTEYTSGKAVRKHISGPELDRHLAMETSTGKIVYMLQDRQMNNFATLNQAGDIISKHAYSPFGEEAYHIGKPSSPYQYTGRHAVGNSGLVDFRFRHYRPDLGRFLTRDLLPDSHSYLYVSNNPLRFNDPLGLKQKGFFSALGEMLNAVARGDTETANKIKRDMGNPLDIAYNVVWGEESTVKSVARGAPIPGGWFVSLGVTLSDWKDGSISWLEATGETLINLIPFASSVPAAPATVREVSQVIPTLNTIRGEATTAVNNANNSECTE